ncbi:MAG: hypothetical protein P8J78_06570 [Maricaulis sp.]|nr:hypothetical protein [Maricaulis sp.]
MSSAIRGALIFLITLSAIIVWLPFSRSWMDGDSYVWGLPILGLDLSGRGLGGAYWVLPPLVALAGVSLWAGWRGSRRIFGVLSGLWFMIWFVSVVVMRSTDGPIMFYGDTLDVAYDISAMAMAISGTGLMASFVMIRAPELDATGLQWAPLNTTFGIFLAALYAVVWGLLVNGEPNGQSDQYGVLALLAMPVLVNLAFMRWRGSAE